jgi:hypothetical protein
MKKRQAPRKPESYRLFAYKKKDRSRPALLIMAAIAASGPLIRLTTAYVRASLDFALTKSFRCFLIPEAKLHQLLSGFLLSGPTQYSANSLVCCAQHQDKAGQHCDKADYQNEAVHGHYWRP